MRRALAAAAPAVALVALVVALLALAGTAAAPAPLVTEATANQAPPAADKPSRSRPAMAVTANSVHRGDQVTLSGGGFVPGANIVVTFRAPTVVITRTVADGAGEFTVSVAVPVSAAGGQHHFEAQGPAAAGGTQVLSAPVRVTATGGHGSWVVPVVMMLLTLALCAAAVITWARLSSHRPLTVVR